MFSVCLCTMIDNGPCNAFNESIAIKYFVDCFLSGTVLIINDNTFFVQYFLIY